MPIHHIVLFKLNDSVTADERASFVPTVEKGLSSIPFGTRAAAGPPMFDVRTSGYEYGLYREFKDLDEFNAYRVHPDHMGLVTGLLKEQVKEMVSFQIQA